ncbi:MAG: hypothetical protein ABIJ96_18185, partial [Elusimicrobiota bacterium]
TPDLNTESLTLTTYYPAPYGAYKELRATETAYLAYVPGGSATPAVGVGLDAPKALLHVSGEMAVENIVGVDSSNNKNLDPFNNGSAPYTYFLNIGNGATSASFRGDIAVGATGKSPAISHNVSGADRVWIRDQYIHLPAPTGCRELTPITTGNGGTRYCTNGEFASWTPGVYQEGTIYGLSVQIRDEIGSILDVAIPQNHFKYFADNKFYCCNI